MTPARGRQHRWLYGTASARVSAAARTMKIANPYRIMLCGASSRRRTPGQAPSMEPTTRDGRLSNSSLKTGCNIPGGAHYRGAQHHGEAGRDHPLGFHSEAENHQGHQQHSATDAYEPGERTDEDPRHEDQGKALERISSEIQEVKEALNQRHDGKVN
jgi:hypothetical protein